MMPHEYEREISNLKMRLDVIDKYVSIQIKSMICEIDDLRKELKSKEPHGQADKQDKERSEEGRKGHKKVAKNG